MEMDGRQLNDLQKITDSYASLSELAGKLRTDYLEVSEQFEKQTQQLEDINRQVTDALTSNSRLSAYLKIILECLDAGVIVFDNEGVISLFNESAERLTGKLREQAIGYNYRELFSGDEHSTTSNLLQSKENRVRGEKWFSEQPVGYSSGKIFDETGLCLGVVEILYDLSAEKKLRETIRHVSALAALGEMSAIVAHQVRNPLAGVLGFADLLNRDLPSDHPSAPLAAKISQGAREVNRIITNLLDFTKKTKPDYRELDLVKFMTDIINSIPEQPFASRLQTKWSCELDSLLYRFDPLLFRQMVYNIAENAAQAMEPNGGILRLSLMQSDDKRIVLEFADSGKGFSDEDAENIFKPFYTTKTNGTGLGLAVVKKVIDFHNGTIQANSKPGEGAVFTITLPL
jgi:PAS domain S-box-containing protein